MKLYVEDCGICKKRADGFWDVKDDEAFFVCFECDKKHKNIEVSI